jgi:DNA-binding Lrp family transcriptional regulator
VKTRLDRMDRLLLLHICDHLEISVAALAQEVGCTKEVAEARLERMRQDGVLLGFHLRVDTNHLPAHEMLVIGVPSDATTGDAIQQICSSPDVGSVFSLAARTSLAFTLRGQDVATLRARAQQLAIQAGLEQHRGILIVKTFHQNAEAGTAWRAPQLTVAK